MPLSVWMKISKHLIMAATALTLPVLVVPKKGPAVAPIPGALTQYNTAIKNLKGPGSKPSERGGRTRRFKKKRLMSKAYCKKTPCKRMGFTQKASCRPYKNCYQ